MRIRVHDGAPDLDLQDPALRLTPPQQAACALDREPLVRAGAGAGKTHTLSIRHLRILLRLAWQAVVQDPDLPRPDLDPVLVLTFTEKAAREMAERCHDRLLRLVRALATPPPDLVVELGECRVAAFRASLLHLLESFDAARISTFHGFCARVLREFPAETAVPPDFVILEEADADPLRDEAVDAEFRELLAGRVGDLPLLLDALGGRGGLLEALRRLLVERGTLGPRIQALARGELPLESWLSRAALGPAEVDARLSGTILGVYDGILTATTGGPVTPFLEDVRDVVGRLSNLPVDVLERYALYSEAVQGLLSASGRARSLTNHRVMGAKREWGPGYGEAKQALADLQVFAEAMADEAPLARSLPNVLDRAHWEVLEALSRSAARVIGRYEAALRQEHALDFASLQARLSQAVATDPTLRRLLQDRHHYLMVDEFQDTDAVQWGMVSTVGRPDGVLADRIFLVGDPKQAIYGFRGGDVTVYSAVERAFAAAGNPPVDLDANFRSRPALITWFNDAFWGILGPADPSRPPWEASYQAIRAGRTTAGGTVTLVTHPFVRGLDQAQADAEAVATLLARAILPGRAPFDGLDLHDRTRHPTPPVGVLLRRRTHLPVLEMALRRNGIPYVVAGGVGFWGRREILDVAHTLHALAFGDPVSLVGALRSPLFGLTDQELWDLQRAGHLERYGPVRSPDGFHARAEEARLRWTRLRSLRHRLSPSALVEAVIETCHARHAAWLDSPDGRAAANLDRLVDIARGYDALSHAGTADLARHLLRRIDDEVREEEAAVAPGDARVVVMTVHAAKGLEFPVVIVPDLSSSRAAQSAALTIGRLDDAWAFACKVADPRDDTLDRGSPGLREALRTRLAAEQEAESRRLFYVACTRAMEHLVLVGGVDGDPKDPPASWMDLLRTTPDAAPTSELALEEVLSLPASEPRLPPPLPEPGPGLLAAAGDLPPIAAAEVNPSALDLFADCPARWFRRVVLGVPERVPTAAERSRVLAAARGNTLHALLQDDLLDDRALIAQRWRVRAWSEGATPEEVEAGLAELESHLDGIRQDPVLARLRKAPGRAEVPFVMDEGGVRVRGVMDRLCEDPDGDGWLVVDYKTGGVHGDPEAAALAYHRQVLVYGLAAARILAKRDDGVGGVRGAIYFTERARLVRFPPWTSADAEGIRKLLEDLGTLLRDRPAWEQVVAQAQTVERPCGTCGYARKGCGR